MLPKKEYGSGSTTYHHRRFQEWTLSKVFEKLWIIRLSQVYDDDLRSIRWNWLISLDGISIKAPLEWGT
jgi:hypothetical protein